MATGKVIVNVVDVGQGQCTFVEIYDDADKLIHSLLFDCGSDKHSDQMTANLDYIAAKVLTMDTPGFDAIFFSHSDKDHISQTRYLLNKINETTKPVVSEVFYAGARSKYTKASFNILNHIETEGYCAADKIFGLKSNNTNYDSDEGKYTFDLWKTPDSKVIVYTIAANALSDNPDWDDEDEDVTGSTAEELNRVSLVCGLYHEGNSYVICGDATNTTMAAINTLFTGGTTVFDQNVMTTLPHHGSRATGLAVKGGEEASASAVDTVTTFAATLKSQTLTDSAYQKHRHPSLELMNLFIPTVAEPQIKDPRLEEANSHLLVAYVDIDLTAPDALTITKGNAYTFATRTNTFSTRYNSNTGADVDPHTEQFIYQLGGDSVTVPKGLSGTNTAVNLFASWVYENKVGGDVTLEGRSNLSSAAFTEAPSDDAEVEMDVEVPEGRGVTHRMLPGYRPAIPLIRPPLSTGTGSQRNLRTFI